MDRRLGGAICIIPVRSQHCGLLFLPFADHDPKTAEIVSKTFLPARDREIKDPAILKQLRPRVNGRVEVPADGQLKVPAPRGCSAGFPGATSSGSGLFHPVGIAVGVHQRSANGLGLTRPVAWLATALAASAWVGSSRGRAGRGVSAAGSGRASR